MSKQVVKIHDKTFRLFISKEEISEIISKLANKINNLNYSDIVFVSVLNGSFMFTSDLCKHIACNPEIQFIKLASYEGAESKGEVTELIGLKGNLTGKHIFVIEDIIDTGKTIDSLCQTLQNVSPKSVSIVTLLFKPDAYKASVQIDFVGRNIENDFVVGYGMDYNELGRELPEIYRFEN